MGYALTLENYQGPIETLLSLIEEQKLEVTTVNLGKVTGDFLLYVEKLEKEGMSSPIFAHLISDFLVIASKLILIKSKALLPELELNQEEVEDIRDLERRVQLYQALKKTNVLLKQKWREFPQMYTREFLMNREPLFYPPEELKKEHLCDALKGLIGQLEKTLKPVALIKKEVINLKERIQHVLERLTENPLNFQSLQKGGKKEDIVVLFMAILHLIKMELVAVSQEDRFGEILIAKQSK